MLLPTLPATSWTTLEHVQMHLHTVPEEDTALHGLTMLLQPWVDVHIAWIHLLDSHRKGAYWGSEHNKDDIAHLELLKKHYKKCVQAYEVHYNDIVNKVILWWFYLYIGIQSCSAEALKEMAAYEKLEVSLQEKHKHANKQGQKAQEVTAGCKLFCASFAGHYTGWLVWTDGIRTKTLKVMLSAPFKTTQQRWRMRRRKLINSSKSYRGKKRCWRASATASKVWVLFVCLQSFRVLLVNAQKDPDWLTVQKKTCCWESEAGLPLMK
jgi:hypothetical protein